jgi:hypothetical protein
LCSTVGDLVRWQRALASGKVVSPASFLAMSTADTLITGRRLAYGFGLVPGMFNGHATVGHGGGINGFVASSMFVPDDTLSVVIFTNSDGASSDAVMLDLLRIAYGGDPMPHPVRPAPVPPAPTVPLPPAERDSIVGSYALQVNGRVLPIRVYVENGQVMAVAEGQRANALNYLGDHVFGTPLDPALRITFAFDAQGRATGMTLLQNGGTFPGPRVP